MPAQDQFGAAVPLEKGGDQFGAPIPVQTGTPITDKSTIGPQPAFGPRLARDAAMTLVDPFAAGSDAWQAIKARANPRQQEIMGNAEQLKDIVQNEGTLLSAPELGESVVRMAGPAAEAVGNAARDFGNYVAEFARKPATPAQSLRGDAGTLKFKPPFHMDFGVADAVVPKGELGTETHPGPYRLISSGPVKPIREAQETASGVGTGAQRPGPGRLILSPEEAATEARQRAAIEKEAQQRGMQHAGGQKPGKAPRFTLPSQTAPTSQEGVSPADFERIRQGAQIASPYEWSEQGGVRWATDPDTGFKVSVPGGLQGSAADKYAAGKINLQKQFAAGRTN